MLHLCAIIRVSNREGIQMINKRELLDIGEYLKKNGYVIAKSNALIQKARYKLTLQQQRIILYAISMIKPEDTELQEYQFDLRELCRDCGITYNGNNYNHFKEAITTLASQVFWITKENGEQTLCHWITKARIDKNNTTVSIRLDEDLKPYLLELRNNYTLLDKSILRMKSAHSQRLYEILFSYRHLGAFDTSVKRLKELLFVSDKYPKYKEFKRNLLEKAVKEINALGELYITYEEIKENRAVSEIKFTIEDFQKNPTIAQNIAEYTRTLIPNEFRK